MILCDRKQLKKSEWAYLGNAGEAVNPLQRNGEMTNAFLITDDDIIICDPEAEYFSLVKRLIRSSYPFVAYGQGH